MADGLHIYIKYNKETSYNSFKCGREGVEGERKRG
jgi:hypothetical protein